jgi:uncharacterized protein (DUF697 family)
MSTQTASALQIVKKYSVWSAGAGLIPIPFADLAVITGVQIKMLAELARVYGVPFEESRGKSLIGAIAGGVASYSLFHGVPGNMVRGVPVLNLVGLVSRPLIAGLVSYGVGSVFVAHFEKGGTLADLDPSSPEARAAYEEGMRKGREELRSQVSPV